MKKFYLLALLVAIVGVAALVQLGGPAASRGPAGPAGRPSNGEAQRSRVAALKERTSTEVIAPRGNVTPETAVAVPNKRPAAATHPLGDRIRAAILAGNLDNKVLEELRLELARDAPGTGRAMLEAMRVESDPTVLIALANLLGANPDVMVSEEALRILISLTESEIPEKRQAGLAALSFANQVTPALMSRVTLMSREDESNEVRVSAIAAMSVWMGREPELGELLTQELVATAHANQDTVVRGHSIQLIANQAQKLDDSVILELQDFLRTESVPENRQLAAYGLGGATGEARPGALAELEQAYLREGDMDTKRVILMQIVRAGQEQAPAILERLPTDNVLVQNDVKDYLDLLGQGIRNPDDIWTRKSLLDADRGTEIGIASAPQRQ